PAPFRPTPLDCKRRAANAPFPSEERATRGGRVPARRVVGGGVIRGNPRPLAGLGRGNPERWSPSPPPPQRTAAMIQSREQETVSSRAGRFPHRQRRRVPHKLSPHSRASATTFGALGVTV